MQKMRIRTLTCAAIGALICIGGAGVGWTVWQINRAVEDCTAVARRHHPGGEDDIASLIAFVNCREHPLRQRNRAVWTLGRLRNSRALPALQALYTAAQCDHQTTLCQYELAKAIERCRPDAKSTRDHEKSPQPR